MPELLNNCHAHRDAMFRSSRMEERLWEKARDATPWLCLAVADGAYTHFNDPKRNSRGEPKPFAQLSVTGPRLAAGIYMDESYMWVKDKNDPWRTNFAEFPSPVTRPTDSLPLTSAGCPSTSPSSQCSSTS
ncbi:hypothetical protein VTI74DRAFT_1727 [Chaetomium olivicolor]